MFPWIPRLIVHLWPLTFFTDDGYGILLRLDQHDQQLRAPLSRLDIVKPPMYPHLSPYLSLSHHLYLIHSSTLSPLHPLPTSLPLPPNDYMYKTNACYSTSVHMHAHTHIL